MKLKLLLLEFDVDGAGISSVGLAPRNETGKRYADGIMMTETQVNYKQWRGS